MFIKRSRVYLLLTQAIMKETVDPVTHQMFASHGGTPDFICYLEFMKR